MTPVYAALLGPAVAAVVGLLCGRRWPRAVVPVAVAGTAVALVATLLLVAWALGDPAPGRAALVESARLATVPTGSLPFGLDLRVDGFAAVVSLAVTVVALSVQVYSTAYLKGDPRYSSYAAFVSLFIAAMLLVVFADDLMVLLVGWEVMGVCSYFLIGHHWEQEDPRAGAIKAFVTTRLGDVGFLFGIFTLGLGAGTFSISGVLAADLSERTATVATLLLLCGVVGKSAQFPLHTWLPDAMAGPTPISALIHAATMVAAGIYLVVRLYEVFLAAPATLAVMAVIAAITMLGAALAALAQEDIKRVLAYSTVSQLAYMLGGLAVGSAAAAGFHLLTHAGFKALLFLAAGSVIHTVGTNLMPDMGGLRRLKPITFVTMTIGLAALAGVPPFAGFFSKEAVLGAAEETALHPSEAPVAAWAGWLVLGVGLLTVAVTAAYVTRLWLMTFFDRPRASVAAHESSPALLWPLVVLAIPSLLLGLVLASPFLLDAEGPADGWRTRAERVLPASDLAAVDLAPHLVTSLLSVLLVLGGAGAVVRAWLRLPAGDPSDVLGRAHPVLEHAFYVDNLYDWAFVRPVRAAAAGVRWADDVVVTGAVRGSGSGAGRLAVLVARTQAGNLSTYLTGLVAGVVVLVVGVVALT